MAVWRRLRIAPLDNESHRPRARCEAIHSATRLVSLYRSHTAAWSSQSDDASTSTNGANGGQVGWAPPLASVGGAAAAAAGGATTPGSESGRAQQHWRQRYLNRFSNARFREKNQQFLELGDVTEGSEAQADTDADAAPQL